jgi:large subunit ribosomal protein L29
MKPSELRDRDDAELATLEKELRDRLLRLRVAAATNKRVTASKFGEVRRDIARIRTIQTERARAAGAKR